MILWSRGAGGRVGIAQATLAEPQSANSNGFAPSEALKRRAEVVQLIERAEIDWLAAVEAIERESPV